MILPTNLQIAWNKKYVFKLLIQLYQNKIKIKCIYWRIKYSKNVHWCILIYFFNLVLIKLFLAYCYEIYFYLSLLYIDKYKYDIILLETQSTLRKMF